MGKKKRSTGKKVFMIILLIGAGLLLILAVLGGVYVNNNLNYYKAPMKAVWKAGFEEKQVTLDDGSIINYGEGGEGIPLLLIHGQCVQWEDYMDVLPEISEYYHVYAVDCYGHGESGADVSKYSAKAIGTDLNWFIENIIGEPCIISGHSSGGLITAWMAANCKDNVLGIVLEDPPFFTTEEARKQEGFAYYDNFLVAHSFLEQSETDDYSLYYLENCEWIEYFGDAGEKVINYAKSYREKNPDKPIEFFFLPPSISRIFLFIDDYDPKFAEAFYDGSWMEDYNHEKTLKEIDCPAVLIHTNWSYENGVLLAAMNGDDADRVCSLIDGSKLIKIDSGHDSHAEKPEEFIKILVDFKENMGK